MNNPLIFILLALFIYYYFSHYGSVVVIDPPSKVAPALPNSAKPLIDESLIKEQALLQSDTYYTPYMNSYYQNADPIPSGPTPVNYKPPNASCKRGFDLVPNADYNTRKMC